MDVRVIWSKAQLEAAARFVSENNPHFLGQLQRIRVKIASVIAHLAEEFPHKTSESTMGFCVQAESIEEEGIDGEENKLSITIMVDPALSKEIFTEHDIVDKTFRVAT